MLEGGLCSTSERPIAAYVVFNVLFCYSVKGEHRSRDAVLARRSSSTQGWIMRYLNPRTSVTEMLCTPEIKCERISGSKMQKWLRKTSSLCRGVVLYV